jgi:hypothetical protein
VLRLTIKKAQAKILHFIILEPSLLEGTWLIVRNCNHSATANWCAGDCIARCFSWTFVM